MCATKWQRSWLTDCSYVASGSAPRQSKCSSSQDIKRRFDTVVDVGSGPGYIARHIDPETTKRVIMLDSSRKLHAWVDLSMLKGAQPACCTET
jgi:NADH dehydrogenase [ubiquinone] 1 alpha subcomplex assembly factor 5